MPNLSQDLYPSDYLQWRAELTEGSAAPIAGHPFFRQQQEAWLGVRERYAAVWQALAQLPEDFVLQDGDAPVLRRNEGELTDQQRQAFEQIITALSPWKKGPYLLGQRFIDSEWRSELKWQRLLPHLPPLKDVSIADIGCNNGYFMLRMLAHRPERIVGFEPYLKHAVHHCVWRHLLADYRDKVALEPMGIQHCDLWPEGFDVMFCLGILYHHTDPVGMLRTMAKALRKKGTIIIDCQGIAGDEELCLVPKQRYAGAAGIWFLPTLPALKNWIRRAGYSYCKVIFDAPLRGDEQRRSKDADIKSLGDFLSEDGECTAEGYPAPRRFYLAIRR